MTKIIAFIYNRRSFFYIGIAICIFMSACLGITDMLTKADNSKTTSLGIMSSALIISALAAAVIVLVCENHSRTVPTQFFAIIEIKIPTAEMPRFVEYVDLYEEMKTAKVTALPGNYSLIRVKIVGEEKRDKILEFLASENKKDRQRSQMN